MAARKEYVTRILLAVVFEGWATQSPSITRIFLATEIEEEEEEKKAEAYALQDLFAP
jgi:hypothetical protein